MDVSVVLTLVQTLLQLLDTPIGEEIESLWGYKSQLEKLKATMSTIRAVLLDAEKQERQQLELSHTLQDKLGRLKEAVYKADDLFDEVATLAQRKKLMSGSSVRKEVGPHPVIGICNEFDANLGPVTWSVAYPPQE